MAITLDVIHQLCMEGESASLDYKRDQYLFVGVKEPEKAELLKDILAMANAFRSQIAYILIGVDQQQDGSGIVIGIPKEQFIDDATLQEFVNGKTNKPIEFHSYSVPIDVDKIIQVVEIPVQNERPYYPRKRLGEINANEVKVRRGSSTHTADPDEIANMGKMDQLQHNQREIEISLIVPQNTLETIDFTALDIVLEGSAPSETKEDINRYLIEHMCRPVYFYEKHAYVRDVFKTFRIDIALENKSSLSAEQLEVEMFISQCSNRCITEKSCFPVRPHDTTSAMNTVSSPRQRGLHPEQHDSAFETRYFEVNQGGDFTIDVTVLGKDMKPIHKSFHILVQKKRYPLHADQIVKMFDLIQNENDYIQLRNSIEII